MDAIRYVTYTADGTLDGCYLQVPPSDHAVRMIVIDEATAADWVRYRANAARDGVELMPPAPPPLPTEADCANAIQGMMDAKVAERRYFGIASACSYENDSDPTFRAEGQACVAWRSAVWKKAYSIDDQVKAGTMAQPPIPDLLAMLPTLTWPT